MSSQSIPRLIPVPPNEQYQNQCWEEPGEEFTDPSEIEAKVQFFLSWRDICTANMILPNLLQVEGRLDYDTDEAIPSCLWLSLSGIDMDGFSSLKTVNVVISLFRSTYRLRCNVLDSDEERLYLAIPTAIKVLSPRTFNRFELSDHMRAQLGACVLHSTSGEVTSVRLLSLSLNCLVISNHSQGQFETGKLQIGETTFDVKMVRRSDSELILEPVLQRNEYSRFFDVYAKVTYPHLRQKRDCELEDVYSLYKESGYLRQFSNQEEESSQRNKIIKAWTNISESVQDDNIDYITIGLQGQLGGASSLSRAFTHGKTEYWAFHQLCAIRREEDIFTTGTLYAWRAEYLMGLPGDSTALVWFRSKSRFIEKIYSKIARIRPDRVRLAPAVLMRGQVKISDGDTVAEVKTKDFAFGNLTRHCTFDSSVIGGIGPEWLNTSGLLDCVLTLSDEDSPEKYLGMAKSLLAKAGETEGKFYFSFLRQQEHPELSTFEKGDSDRLCIFPKSALPDLLSSIEHAIAITQRKKEVS